MNKQHHEDYMRLHKKNGRVAKSFILGCLIFSTSIVFGESMSSASKFYTGIFGGVGSVTETDFKQYGSVYVTEASGGPLGINAFGHLKSETTGLAGAHLGFKLPVVHMLQPVTPAVELEGFYLSGGDLKGHANNNTIRLIEHDFAVTYPWQTGVFLINAVINANEPLFKKAMPYFGVGFGSAVGHISGAKSFQVNPEEQGINHYIAKRDDRAATFAAQAKAGLSFNLNHNTRIFAEYRHLYLYEMNYIFGSTLNLLHAETSSWSVKFDPQHYNMAIVGFDFTL